LVSGSQPLLGGRRPGCDFIRPVGQCCKVFPQVQLKLLTQSVPAKLELCLICSSYGSLSSLLFCHDCGQCFHSFCLNPPLDPKRLPNIHEWRCPDCKFCETCSKTQLDDELILCDECDRAYHPYCVANPPNSNLDEGWRCSDCAICKHCGTKDPGSISWSQSGTLCLKCYDIYKGKVELLKTEIIKKIPQPTRSRKRLLKDDFDVIGESSPSTKKKIKVSRDDQSLEKLQRAQEKQIKKDQKQMERAKRERLREMEREKRERKAEQKRRELLIDKVYDDGEYDPYEEEDLTKGVEKKDQITLIAESLNTSPAMLQLHMSITQKPFSQQRVDTIPFMKPRGPPPPLNSNTVRRIGSNPRGGGVVMVHGRRNNVGMVSSMPAITIPYKKTCKAENGQNLDLNFIRQLISQNPDKQPETVVQEYLNSLKPQKSNSTPSRAPRSVSSTQNYEPPQTRG